MLKDEKPIRVPTAALTAASAIHVTTTVSRIGRLLGELNGRTQWVGVLGCARFDVSWDWAMVSDVVVVLRPGKLRANVELIDARGCLQSPERARVCVLEWIESLPWREQVKAHALDS